ncbi:hypothetical protein ABZP36_004463 [Zizania latifolia]
MLFYGVYSARPTKMVDDGLEYFRGSCAGRSSELAGDGSAHLFGGILGLFHKRMMLEYRHRSPLCEARFGAPAPGAASAISTAVPCHGKLLAVVGGQI